MKCLVGRVDFQIYPSVQRYTSAIDCRHRNAEDRESSFCSFSQSKLIILPSGVTATSCVFSHAFASFDFEFSVRHCKPPEPHSDVFETITTTREKKYGMLGQWELCSNTLTITSYNR
mmetsp:Transcript_3285/g.7809  ORF Transcript_3285/g.7809 Transcript_3285/m.7809 type:complete len:117 (-) Transcript_3285:99-449(-)